MDAGLAGARLASSVVAPLVKQLFVREGRGAGLVDRPVRVSGLFSFRGEKHVLGAGDVRRIAAELVARSLDGVRERPLTADEEPAVVEALATTLLALGEVTMDDVQAVRLGHRELARTLRTAAPQAGRDLSADAELFYLALLDTACLHVLHFFTQRSTFVPRQQVEQSRQLAQVIARLDQLAARTPSLPLEDARFEDRYAEFVVRRHSSLTIAGLDLRDGDEWQLDAAYLSLEAERADVPTDPEHDHAVGRSRQSADRALAGHERVLLRGLAGSGKTTLVQWLAVTAARQDTTAGLPHLLGRVPFVLPLRTLTRGGAGLPPPADFLAATGCPLSGSQPAGWADRVLAEGRGLLLVDGVDEVPENERSRTRRWLRDLLAAFPDNLWLVTSRPSAVREDWLAREDFTELTLSPMRQPDVTTFVERWHTAAGAEVALRDALLTTLRTQHTLGRLATNPLMCGLLCALHRERRGHLPRGRKALYDAALGMLLYRRDREREIHGPDDLDLDDETQTELLQKLAYWLIRNGRSELSHSDAVKLVARVLPAMPHVADQGDAADVLRHLLLRSGLLREPAPGAVDFVHRTFQDYLGAREAVEESDFDLLTRNAHLDQWEDVLRMAVAHARPDERARLLTQLLTRGDTEPDHRTRLHLLATACLEHATKLDPAVRTAIEDRAAALIPPRSIDEAKALTAAGPVVLELLPGPEGLRGDEAEAVAHTACQLGTDAAIPLLHRYFDHHSKSVGYQLAGHWDRFDTVTYASEIIQPLIARTELPITAYSPGELAQLAGLGCTRVRLHGDHEPEAIVTALDHDHLVELEIASNARVGNLDFIRGFNQLSSLFVRHCPHLRNLDAVSALPLHTLRMWELPALPDLEALRGTPGLHTLVLGSGLPWWGASIGELPVYADLTDLRLPPGTSLHGLERWTRLKWLSRSGDTSPVTPEDWAVLCRLPELSSMFIEPEAWPTAHSEFPPLTTLRFCTVESFIDTRHIDEVDLTTLVRLFPALEDLAVRRVQRIDLAPLAALLHLKGLTLYQVDEVTGLESLPPHVRVHRFPRPRA